MVESTTSPLGRRSPEERADREVVTSDRDGLTVAPPALLRAVSPGTASVCFLSPSRDGQNGRTLSSATLPTPLSARHTAPAAPTPHAITLQSDQTSAVAFDCAMMLSDLIQKSLHALEHSAAFCGMDTAGPTEVVKYKVQSDSGVSSRQEGALGGEEEPGGSAKARGLRESLTAVVTARKEVGPVAAQVRPQYGSWCIWCGRNG